MQSEAPIKVLGGHNSEITSVIFNQDEKYVFVGTMGGSIHMWDLEAQRICISLREHMNSCNSLAVPFSPAAFTLVSGSQDTNVKIWDLRSGKSFCTFKPIINKINCEKNINYDRCEILFNDAKRRMNNIKNISKLSIDYSFKPDITLTQEFNEGIIPHKFLERNMRYHKRNKSVSNYSDNMHKPKVGREPKIIRNIGKLPIGDYLYSQDKHIKELNEIKLKNELT